MTTIQLAMACDDRYSLPLAVAVRSLLEQLEPSHAVELFIVDAGVTRENQGRCELAWHNFPVQCHWLRPTADVLHELPVSAALPIATYFRLLLPTLLPNVSKLLYLDPDLLVLRSLAPLWSTQLGDQPLAAAQDLACPYVHFPSAMANYSLARRYLLGCDPIPNYGELGLAADRPYFNAGVMLLNLEVWRKERLGEQLIEFTRQHAAHNVSADQYSLNACLGHRRVPLDIRWNQLQAIYDFPGWRESPLDATTFRQVRDEPWIAHFAGPGKPWEGGNRHRLRSEYLAVLDRTPWAGWRPTPPVVPWSRRARRTWRTGRDWVGARWRRARHSTPNSAKAA